MICIHHNDMDGRCAAAIVLAAKQFVKFIEMSFNKELDLSLIQPNEEVFIVDFSLSNEVMDNLLNITKNVVWIDHHATAQEYSYQYLPGLRDFKNKSMSGCELAWKYFFDGVQMPAAVQFIGDLDKWAWNFQPECGQFYEGIKLYDNSPTSSIWPALFDDTTGFSHKILEEGKIAVRYRNNYCRDLLKAFGFETEIEYYDGHDLTSYRAYACNEFMFGSLGFFEKMDDYPVCIAFIFDGKNYSVSMYSTKVDVSVIAKAYGGGGHKGSAGFQCKELPFKIKENKNV